MDVGGVAHGTGEGVTGRTAGSIMDAVGAAATGAGDAAGVAQGFQDSKYWRGRAGEQRSHRHASDRQLLRGTVVEIKVRPSNSRARHSMASAAYGRFSSLTRSI